MIKQIRALFYILLVLSIPEGSAAGQVRNNSFSPLPEEIATRVADRIVEETTFAFQPSLPGKIDEGYYYIDFYDSLGAVDNGLYFARADILVKEGEKSALPDDALSTVRMGISHSAGDIEISLDGKVIYRKKSNGMVLPKGMDYDRYIPADYVKLSLPDNGHYRLAIKMAPAGPAEARLWVGFFAKSGASLHNSISLKPPALKAAPGYYHFLVAGPVDAGEKGMDSHHSLNQEALDFSRDYEGAEGRKIRWDLPRIHLVRKHSNKLEYADWRYFTGTILDSLFNVTDTFENLDYQPYINRHMNFFLEKIDLIAREREEYGRLHSPFGHYFRFALLDDVGITALPFAERYIRKYGAGALPEANDPDYKIARKATDHIMKNIPRLDDGTVGRINPVALTVWADDMFMVTGILMRMSKAVGNNDYRDEAIKQILLIDKHLSDPATGVYWHGWFGDSKTHSSSKWGRANGWTIMAKTDALLALDKSHEKYSDLLKAFQIHAKGLLKLQSDDGRWHQVLDNPATYLETSASAMFIRAFAEGIRNGWLPEDEFSDATFKGWKAVTGQIRQSGLVEGIVKGTPIFFSDEQYNNQPIRLNDPRGLGAVLYMAVSMEKLRKGREQVAD